MARHCNAKQMRRIDLRLARTVLSKLDKCGGSLRRRDLEKHTLMEGYGTRAAFDSVLTFLKEHGYLAKAHGKYTAPYQITDKGRRFLEALSG